MPFLTIKVTAALQPHQVERLGTEATRLMVEVLHKSRDLIAVLVEQTGGRWTIGGKSVAMAAHLDVKVSAGTNSTEEKARFIVEAMNLLREVIGPGLAPVTYVVVDEVPGDAWGWNGQTQAVRATVRQAARPPQSARGAP